MAALLQAAGYEVTVVLDGTKSQLRAAVTELAHRVGSLPSTTNCIVVVHFSGHGVERGGENFLVPVDGVTATQSGNCVLPVGWGPPTRSPILSCLHSCTPTGIPDPPSN
jgi:hypothetical protein